MTLPTAPPKGGPMVVVDGFPGPLYPPDAAPGHQPSRDSPFVLACKRTLGRIGAWPWDPDGWDDSYSNSFAHGVKGDPARPGIAGAQRWSGTLEATGWVGERTFNFLRSVKVPQGRTHAGEPAMDSYAAQLVDQAYLAAFPPLTLTIREAALEQAIAELGVAESPAGSNICPYSDWYGMVGPWCAMFTTWCYETAGGSPTFVSGDRYAYVPYIVSDARQGRYGLSVTSSPLPGDLVCYDWERNGEYDHVGLFEQWTGAHTFQAIEGNTSTSDNSNGGEVMRRYRDVNGQATVFVRVHE